MPVYTYHCTACANTFDRWRPERRRDDRLTCPLGHDTVARLPGLDAKPEAGNGNLQGHGGAV